MRISDWSSDVCSSDLCGQGQVARALRRLRCGVRDRRGPVQPEYPGHEGALARPFTRARCLGLARGGVLSGDRKSGVEGKSVSVRVDLGGRRIIKKKKSRERREKLHTYSKR